MAEVFFESFRLLDTQRMRVVNGTMWIGDDI